jgi:repressor LexA
MTKELREEKLKSRIREISSFYYQKGRMPSFSEIGEMLGLKSKNAVSKLINKLEQLKVIEKDGKGRLIPGSIKFPVRILGTVEAGFPSPAEEELADTLSLDELLIRNHEAAFLLKVSGDSMSEAGILPGDMVIVDKGKPPKSGDIVIAEVDGEWTMKYLRKRGNSVTLIPANSKYKPIKPKNELKIAGVVTAVVRKYQ